VRATDLGSIIERTEGASPAFIRELLRRAALFALESTPDGVPVVQDTHLSGALDELTSGGGPLTSKLLGMQRSDEA